MRGGAPGWLTLQTCRNENILSSTDEILGFIGKLILWREALEQGSMDMFPLASAGHRQEGSTLYVLNTFRL